MTILFPEPSLSSNNGLNAPAGLIVANGRDDSANTDNNSSSTPIFNEILQFSKKNCSSFVYFY